jgi:flavin reductase (DIM6/NTAB) family NADH-FMN oxidoreductase RutF
MTQTSFVSAMAAAVTGVSVVTTDGASGRLGLTVSAMTSVSASPPMLLVCIDRGSPLLPAIAANRVFAVNALGVRQIVVADTFAGRPQIGEPFDFGVAAWERGGTGVPLLVGAAARFECLVAAMHEAGSHTIVVGDVMASDRHGVRALAYNRRDYARPVPLQARRPHWTAARGQRKLHA